MFSTEYPCPFHSGGLGVEAVFARRCATVRNRGRPCESRMAVPMASSAKSCHFWRFPMPRSLVLRGRRGTSWYSVESRFVWQAQYFCDGLELHQLASSDQITLRQDEGSPSLMKSLILPAVRTWERGGGGPQRPNGAEEKVLVCRHPNIPGFLWFSLQFQDQRNLNQWE